MSGHLSDRELLQLLDGELDSADLRGHLEHCAACRERSDRLANASVDFGKEYRGLVVPAAKTARTALLTRLRPAWRAWWTAAAAAVILIALGIAAQPRRSEETSAEPLRALTPGATRSVSRETMCGAERAELRRVAGDVARQVFRRYGIQSPPPNTYEIDYLIPPDLGGSEDPRNLWPQPYARGVWNARVKDALEDRLRSLVCDGKIDLETAQRDLARDWIGAYKRYFRTEAPLMDHVAFYKDRPWE